MTNVIGQQSAEARKKRQEEIKREKDEQRKAMGAAQKLKLKAFGKKQQNAEETDTPFLGFKLNAGEMAGKARSDRAPSLKIQEVDKIEAEKPKELVSETLRKARGPYNEADPLHMCHLNHNCHRRNIQTKRCGLHEIGKEDSEKKQKVKLLMMKMDE